MQYAEDKSEQMRAVKQDLEAMTDTPDVEKLRDFTGRLIELADHNLDTQRLENIIPIYDQVVDLMQSDKIKVDSLDIHVALAFIDFFNKCPHIVM